MSTERNQTTLRLTVEMDNKLIELSRKMGISKNAYILMLLSGAIQKAS